LNSGKIDDCVVPVGSKAKQDITSENRKCEFNLELSKQKYMKFSMMMFRRKV
jgi:hypothetical protein